MKNLHIIFYLLFYTFPSFSQIAPDSGFDLIFSNAINNRVNIPSSISFNNPSNNITIEAWINPSAYTIDGEMIFSKVETNPLREYYIYIQPNGLLRFALIDNLDVAYLTLSTTTIPLNIWTHVAATYSFASGISRIYINGIQNIANNIGSITIATTNIRPLIGAYWLSNNITSRSHFQGAIDEVRLWHIERTQTQIRNNMCRSLIIPQVNLIAYYKLDEASGAIAADLSGNGNDGALQFFPPAQITNRPYSGAPIGDVSINSYLNQPANWMGMSFTLNSVAPAPAAPIDARSIKIDNITGTPDGIHLFRVNSLPSQLGGLTTPINTYFGTFIVNESTPATPYSYRAVYDYTPLNGNSCEPQFQLFSRNNNSIPAWNNVGAINVPSNTITVVGNTTRQELILETFCIPLPVELISFDVKLKKENEASIKWSTKNEHDNYAFYIERSQDSEYFETITKLNVIPESSTFKEYDYTDTLLEKGVYYYRIKQVDLNGDYSYSEIKVVDHQETGFGIIYPNPGKDIFTIKVNNTTTIVIMDIQGKIVRIFNPNISETYSSKTIDLSDLSSGIYLINFFSKTSKITKKLIIQ
jgi:hypothetical protein